MPVVRDLVRNAELSMEDIGLFAVANGPGSFTGLRKLCIRDRRLSERNRRRYRTHDRAGMERTAYR